MTLLYWSSVVGYLLWLSTLKQELAKLRWQDRQVRTPAGYVKQPLQSYLMGETDYAYAGGITKHHEWTPIVKAIMEKINSKYDSDFNSCLLNKYEHGGEYVGYHSDSERQLARGQVIVADKTYTGSMVATISIGATRRFAIRKVKTTTQLDKTLLHEGDLVLMAGTCQQTWNHSILKQKGADEVRYSLTYRHLDPEIVI